MPVFNPKHFFKAKWITVRFFFFEAPLFFQSFLFARFDAPLLRFSLSGDPVRVVHLEEPEVSKILFPRATFMMGSTPSQAEKALSLCRQEILSNQCEKLGPSFRAEGKAHQVELSSFYIDRSEVSVAKYQKCVFAGRCEAAHYPPQDPRFNASTFPVTHVSWKQAVHFCSFAGGRLPTEAEWEYVAKGVDSRIFPWGNNYDAKRSNHGSFSRSDLDTVDGYMYLAPINSFPSGRTSEGVYDLSGNVSEWTQDFFDLNSDGFGYESDTVVNPQGANHGTFHVIRGGSFRSGRHELRTTARTALVAPYSAHVGFRCAYDLVSDHFAP